MELSEFNSIYNEIESKYPEYEIKFLSKQKKNRTRDIGAGRHFKHSVRDRFRMLLVYYKLYITHILSGFLFDLDQSNVHRDIRYMEPLVSSCIPLPQKLYNLTRRLRTVQEVEIYFPWFKSFIDSTEHEIQRRAGMVTFILERQGYNVKTLEEGLKGWSSALEHYSQK